ncbi:hypothetical protein BDV95DRAFT_488490 [Massariosphaeria phaeospora]|uniref:Cupredoxin n=1 Tax=Massariosphaeria phaeospora TaxID=100035 RepID=A0A7C8M945_9PLEO|nr:hypothetical protein BDV95DRAFT_488490 [Massariosphaeria phaeospora]
MYFSRSVVVSALLGLGAATTHAGEAVAPTAAVASHVAAAAPTAAVASHVVAEAPSAAATHVAAPAGEAMVNMHVVQVGGANATLAFFPEHIVAAPGDLVQFQFNAKNHSVVQSTFDQPCIPIQNITPNKTDAFFSGFMPTNASITSTQQKLTYTIRVMDTKPIWFYCSQGMHCQSGMVGAVNAPASGNKTLAGYKALAGAATQNLSPGQVSGAGSAAPPGSPGAPGAGGAGPVPTVAPSSTVSANPAEQSVNAAPGSFSDVTRHSFVGLGLAALAAFVAL